MQTFANLFIEFYLVSWLCVEGVQKERMQPEDMYILSPNGSIISAPSPKPYPNKPPKCTDCAPLFMKVFWFCSPYKIVKLIFSETTFGLF